MQLGKTEVQLGTITGILATVRAQRAVQLGILATETAQRAALQAEVDWLRAERMETLKAAGAMYARGFVELHLKILWEMHGDRTTSKPCFENDAQGKQTAITYPDLTNASFSPNFTALMRHWRLCAIRRGRSMDVIIAKPPVTLPLMQAKDADVLDALAGLHGSLSESVHGPELYGDDNVFRIAPLKTHAETLALMTFLQHHKVRYVIVTPPRPVPAASSSSSASAAAAAADEQ